jgi:hypothetical protein
MTVPTPIRGSLTISGSRAAGLTFTFASLGNTNVKNYFEYTTTLRLPYAWNTVTSTPCTGNITSLSDRNPADQQRFYRIRVQ